jgi:hypothetical protein
MIIPIDIPMDIPEEIPLVFSIKEPAAISNAV